MHGDFLISSTHAGFFLFVCFFSVLVFNVCFPKGRKKKMKKERALGLPIPRTLLRPEREGLETNVVPLPHSCMRLLSARSGEALIPAMLLTLD